MINKGSGFGSNNLSGMLHKGGMHDGGAASMSAQLSQGLVSGVDPDQPAFDSSDFPSLGGERAGGPDDGHMGLGDQYSLSSLHKAGSQHSEFSMQNEDFPALPSNATSNFGHSGNDEMQGGNLSWEADPVFRTSGFCAGDACTNRL